MSDLITIQEEVKNELANPEVFNALLGTTFKGLSAETMKVAIMDGMIRGFTFKDFRERNVYAIPFGSTYHYFPTPAQLASGTTCGSVSNVTDPALCLNDIYLADNGVASTSVIYAPSGAYSTANVFNANIPGHYIDFKGQGGGGTVWKYTGTTTPANQGIFTIDDCLSGAKAQVTQLENLTINGVTATTTGGGVTGIYAGSTSTVTGGGCATKVDSLNIGNVTYGLVMATSTYWWTDTNLNIHDTYRCLWQQGSGTSNSGENIDHDNLKCANPASFAIGGVASATKEIFIDNTVTPSTVFISPSFDEGAYYQGPGNTVTWLNPHLEDSTITPPEGPYDRVTVASSSQYGALYVFGGVSNEDATSSNGGPINTIFNCGGTCVVDGFTVIPGGGATTTVNFMTNTAGPSTANESVSNITNGGNGTGFTYLMNGQIPNPSIGQWYTSLANSWVMGYGFTSTNLMNFQNGGSTQLAISPTGVGIPGTLNVTSTANFNATTTAAGNFTVASGATYALQANPITNQVAVGVPVDTASSYKRLTVVNPSGQANDSQLANYNNNSGNAAIFLNSALSDYSWFEMQGTNADYKMGMAAGNNNFAITDSASSTVPFTIERSAPSNALYVRANGNVGIGTASPGVTLNVAGASSTVRIGTPGNVSHGCIELYDAVNSSTLMYVYSSSSVLVATSTKPNFCQ